jgi:hypothetical protein
MIGFNSLVTSRTQKQNLKSLKGILKNDENNEEYLYLQGKGTTCKLKRFSFHRFAGDKLCI